LASLLPSSNEITQEHILSILVDISQSSHKQRTIFRTVKSDFRGRSLDIPSRGKVLCLK